PFHGRRVADLAKRAVRGVGQARRELLKALELLMGHRVLPSFGGCRSLPPGAGSHPRSHKVPMGVGTAERTLHLAKGSRFPLFPLWGAEHPYLNADRSRSDGGGG